MINTTQTYKFISTPCSTQSFSFCYRTCGGRRVDTKLNARDIYFTSLDFLPTVEFYLHHISQPLPSQVGPDGLLIILTDAKVILRHFFIC